MLFVSPSRLWTGPPTDSIDLGTDGVVGGRNLPHGGELVKLGRMPTIIRRDERSLDSTSESILDSRKGPKNIEVGYQALDSL